MQGDIIVYLAQKAQVSYCNVAEEKRKRKKKKKLTILERI
jgi:hypothetical protein